MNGALAKFRVLDLSESVAGQFCCRMMADFGAHVTLVEPPAGSAIRDMPPFDPKADSVGSMLFFHLNLGKHAITLDWQSEQGAALLTGLVGSADVVVVGLGIDRDKLSQANPDCIVALVSDFGDDGPYKHWRGSEMIIQALSGMMNANGEADRQPLYGVGHRASYAAGVGAYITILSALYARKRIGKGQQVAVDVAMNTSSMAPPASLEYSYSKMMDTRGERRMPFCAVQCRDGWVSLWIHLHTWSDFCTQTELTEIAQDPRFAKGKERQDNWAELVEIIQRRVRDWTTDDLLARLLRARVAAAIAYSPLKLYSGTPHLAERNFWGNLETPSGPQPILGPQYRMAATPRHIRSAPPRIGEDNVAIYGADLDQLRQRGVV